MKKVEDFYGPAIRYWRKRNYISMRKLAARMEYSWFELFLKEKGYLRTTMTDIMRAADAIPCRGEDIIDVAELKHTIYETSKDSL